MTCKDCLHYEACKGTYDILDTTCSGEFDYEEFASSCKNFTDRSEHLPDVKGLCKSEAKNNLNISFFQPSGVCKREYRYTWCPQTPNYERCHFCPDWIEYTGKLLNKKENDRV